MAENEPRDFDPSKYLTKLQGRDYLEVKWRLVWLRAKHPDAEIDTELKNNEPDEAVFKATIRIPGGGSASGWGSETQGDFRDFREKAETKAIGRALAALGFGTQFCEDHDFGSTADPPRVVDTPVMRSAAASAIRPAPRQNAAPDLGPPPAQPTMSGFEQSIAGFRDELESAQSITELGAVAERIAAARLPTDAPGRSALADIYTRRLNEFRQPTNGNASDQMATPKQVKFLQSIAREAGIAEVDLHHEIEERYGKPISDLGRRDASAFIEILQARRGAIAELAN